MRRVFVFCLLFVISVVLQSTVFNFLKVGGVKPDLLLVIVVLSAVFNGKKTGGAVGFAYGFFEDLLVGKYIGARTLSKMLAGYAVGLLERKIFPDNFIVPIVVGILGTAVHNAVYFAVMLLAGASSFTLGSFVSQTVSSGLYNLCVAMIAYGPMYNSSVRGVLKM